MKRTMLAATLMISFTAFAQNSADHVTTTKAKSALKKASVKKKASTLKKGASLQQASASVMVAKAEDQESGGSASSALNKSTTTLSEVAAPKKSGFSGSVIAIINRDALLKDDSSNAKVFDNDATNFDTELHIKPAYKFENGMKLALNQRLFYSDVIKQDRQQFQNVTPGTLRTELSMPMTAMGASGGTTLRLALPTTQAAQDANLSFGWAVMPSLNWELNPKWSVGYSGYVGGSIYNGKANKGLDYMYYDIKNNVVNGYTQSQLDGYLARTAEQRQFVYIVNGVSVSYNFTDKLSLSQSLGYDFGLSDMSKNFANFERRTAAWEIGTELGLQASQNVAFAFGISQQVADMPGAADLITGKAIYFDDYNFALYRPEQTTYSVTGSVSF